MVNNKVLIIDDEDIVLESIRKDISEDQYEIFIAKNGEEGLAKYKGEQPSLIILDLKMPVIDGIEFLERLELTSSGSCAVIVLTGHGDEEEIKRCFDLGVYTFIRKPYNIYVLRGTVRNAIKLKQSQNRLINEIEVRKETEERLQKSEARFFDVATSMSDWIWEVDVQGKFTYVSGSVKKILGYDEKELQGKTPFDLMSPEEAKRVNKIFARISANKNPIVDLENWNLTKDGHKVCLLTNGIPILDNEGKLLGYRGVDKDITERKKADEALKTSEERLRSLSKATFEGIAFHKKGVIIDCNEQFAEIVEYKLDELIGIDGSTLLAHPEDRELALSKIATENEDPYEMRLLCKDGSIKFVKMQAQMMLINGERLRVTAIRDITEQKKMEEELLKMQKLESVGILAGGIAHDFNNYLQGILSNNAMALALADPKSEFYVNLLETKKVVHLAKNLTQQLLTFSKGGDPIKKVASVPELIKESAMFATRGSNVRCELFLPDYNCNVEVDKGQIHQVINEIIINAGHAMPGGGVIKVNVELCSFEKESLLPLQEGEYIKITIKDRGVGISHENIQKIFDPYFTTKETGSGLGLATAFSIIKKHNGHIDVESEIGAGTSFHIYIPVSQKDAIKEPGKSKIVEISPELIDGESTSITFKGKMLIMDDEDIIRAIIGEHMRLRKYEVETAKDGSEAIVLYKEAMESGKPFDVVLLDLTISGGMGGKETIEKLHEIDPDVKAIVASGYSDDPVMTNFVKYGFKGVVEKPFDIDTIDDELQKVIMEK